MAGAYFTQNGRRDSQSLSDGRGPRRGGGVRTPAPAGLAELEAALVDHGVRTYSIFLDAETNDLFGYAEIDCEEQWNAIAFTEVCRRWWRHMRDLMPTNPDDGPVSRDLREVFHIGPRE